MVVYQGAWAGLQSSEPHLLLYFIRIYTEMNKTKRKIIVLLVLLVNIFLIIVNRGNVFSADESNEYIWVQIISRPIAKKNELIPRNIKRFHHLVVISDVLPHGVWEMGPDEKGMIATTNTVNDFLIWQTHLVTQKYIESGGNYIRSKFVEVNKRGLLDAIKWYEESWVGKFKYSFYSYNENYAVNTVIYAAGGPSNVGK